MRRLSGQHLDIGFLKFHIILVNWSLAGLKKENAVMEEAVAINLSRAVILGNTFRDCTTVANTDSMHFINVRYLSVS